MVSPRRTATLKEVAQRAGVATSTVSRYLNNPKVVAESTGKRIQAAIDAEGYIPNLTAGELASKRSRLVAVLIPQISNSLLDTTIDAMAARLADAGFTVLLGLTGLNAERTEQIVRSAISRRVDAIVSGEAIPDDMVDLVRRSETTFIQIWELPDDPIDIAVGFSNRSAGREMARFVSERGYTRPRLLTAEGPRAIARSEGFKEYWSEHHDSPVTEELVPLPSHYGQARRAFAEIRRLNALPDIVVCGSDGLAQGVIVEATSFGFRVPEDIAVMGFGNSSIAGEMRPTITTVDTGGTRIAGEVIGVLKRKLAGKENVERRIDIGFHIVARESA